MGRTLNLIMFDSQLVVSLLSFIFSLRLIKNKYTPVYMRSFFIYPAVGLLIIIPLFLTTHFFKSYKPYSSVINNLSTIFHYCFLGAFIIRVMPNRSNNNVIKLIFATFLLLIFIVLFKEDITKPNSFAFATANLGLTIFCIIYYFKLFNNLPILDLKNEPSFWVITGVFFCMSTHIPLITAYDYLINKISLYSIRIINLVAIFCYVVMHLFFIKACLCSVRLQKA